MADEYDYELTDADAPAEDGSPVDQTPPHNADAEKSMLGAMLIRGDAVQDVLEAGARPADCYLPRHEVIFTAILTLHEQGKRADQITVSDELARTGQIRQAGEADYLHTLAGFVPTASNAGYYARIVSDHAARRRLLDATTKIAQTVRDDSTADGVDKVIEEARAVLDRAAGSRVRAVEFSDVKLMRTIDSLDEDVKHVPSPWPALNQWIQGFSAGRLYVIGARPGAGKSALALQITMALAQTGGVAFSSLEMSADELHLRMISQGANVPLSWMSKPRLISDAMWTSIASWRAVNTTALQNLAIDAPDSASVTDLRSFARSVDRKRPLAAIVVDYLQLMAAPGNSRQEEVASVTRGLKLMAREFGVPIIALSQLNRGGMDRGRDPRPTLRDLRESGAIEQDADVVILLHRHADAKSKDKAPTTRTDPVLELLVAKNRHAQEGVARLRWQGEFVRAVGDDWAGAGQDGLWSENEGMR